jgi:hypothetical protein
MSTLLTDAQMLDEIRDIFVVFLDTEDTFGATAEMKALFDDQKQAAIDNARNIIKATDSYTFESGETFVKDENIITK